MQRIKTVKSQIIKLSILFFIFLFSLEMLIMVSFELLKLKGPYLIFLDAFILTVAVFSVSYYFIILPLIGLSNRELFLKEQIIASISEGVCVCNNKTFNVLFCNHAVEDMYQYTSNEIIGSSLNKLLTEDSQKVFESMVREGSDYKSGDFLSVKKDKRYFWTQYTLSLCHSKNHGDVVIVSIVDIENRKALESNLEELAIKDTLTGLYNRHKFNEIAKNLIDIKNRFKTDSAIVIIDVDNFKMINDVHGHNIGDKVLKHIAKHIANRIRAVDYAFRWGGDEFVLLLTQTSIEDAQNLARDIKQNIHEFQFDDENLNVEISVGISSVHTSPEESIYSSDKALYLAKGKGKNIIELLFPNKDN